MAEHIKFPNGSTGPLNMSSEQRGAFLAKHGMHMGWLLLTRDEMLAMKKNMDKCQSENERLNKQTARLVAERITAGDLKGVGTLIQHAADLLEADMTALKESHSVDGVWDGNEPFAQKAYEDMEQTVSELRAIKSQ